MGISLDNYRVQIGLHIQKNSDIKSSKIEALVIRCSLLTFIYFYLLIMPDNFVYISSQSANRQFCYSFTVNLVIIQDFFLLFNGPTIRWSHVVVSNVLCHNLFGNRRRLSYKLTLWNCRRGILNNQHVDSSKFIEVKHFIC